MFDIQYTAEGNTIQIANHTDHSLMNTTFPTLQAEIDIYYGRKRNFEHDSVYGFFDLRTVTLSFEVQEKFPRAQVHPCSDCLAIGAYMEGRGILPRIDESSRQVILDPFQHLLVTLSRLHRGYQISLVIGIRSLRSSFH